MDKRSGCCRAWRIGRDVVRLGEYVRMLWGLDNRSRCCRAWRIGRDVVGFGE